MGIQDQIDPVFSQGGCGSALPELVPLLNGVKGKSIPVSKGSFGRGVTPLYKKGSVLDPGNYRMLA
eukprot:670899-Pelagomonas_calceolata.AAC.1